MGTIQTRDSHEGKSWGNAGHQVLPSLASACLEIDHLVYSRLNRENYTWITCPLPPSKKIPVQVDLVSGITVIVRSAA